MGWAAADAADQLFGWRWPQPAHNNALATSVRAVLRW